MSEMAYEGHVKLPASYYAKSKTEYADWRQAWFREAIQNEIDAGATRIDFTVGAHPDDSEKIRLVCHGNGSGMDEDKLFNAFLTLGGSQKGEGSIGGFGYAKVILAFAHSGYEIETQGIHLRGTGGSYKWTTGNEVLPGVRLTVEMTTQDVQTWVLEEALNKLIHHSRLPGNVTITLNGNELSSNPHDHPYRRQTPLGLLTFKDQPHGISSSVLWVRMKGLAMFQERLYMGSGTAFEGYLELEGDSKTLLTSNRDSLNRDHRDILNQIVQSLANDREKLKLSGDIDVMLNERCLRLQNYSLEVQEEVRDAARSMGKGEDEMLEYLNAAADEVHDERAKHPFHKLISKVNRVKDLLNSRIERIPSHWYPENFKVKFLDECSSPEDSHKHASEITSKMALKRYGKMAAGWSAIVNTLLDCSEFREALRVKKSASGEFFHEGQLVHTGFVFGTPEGLCQRDDKQGRVGVMVNPRVVDDESLSVGDLIDIALHELTHIEIDYHGEGFTTKESRMRRIMRREIGERELSQAFDSAISQWRDQHSDKKAGPVRRKQPHNESDFSL